MDSRMLTLVLVVVSVIAMYFLGVAIVAMNYRQPQPINCSPVVWNEISRSMALYDQQLLNPSTNLTGWVDEQCLVRSAKEAALLVP